MSMRHLPLLWISLAFLSGLALAPGITPESQTAFLLTVLLFITGWLIRKKQWLPEIHLRWNRICPFPPLWILALFFLGLGRYAQALPIDQPQSVHWHVRQDEVILRGVVSRFPDERSEYTQLTVFCETLQIPPAQSAQKVKGLVLIRLPWQNTWQPGEEIVVQGQLKIPSSSPSFSYKNYLAQQNIHAIMYYPKLINHQPSSRYLLQQWLWKIRKAAEKVLFRVYPHEEAALLDGILLGNDRNMADSTMDAFRNTGTAHLIAISGFNIAILSNLIALGLSKLFGRRFSGLWLTVAIIALYSILVGGQPPVVRAAIMGSISLTGSYIGRKSFSWNSLVFTAAVMAFFNPFLPASISFQLSFAACLGLMLLAEPMTAAFRRFLEIRLPALSHSNIVPQLADYVILTLAAQISTIPILANAFHRFPLIGLFANLAVLPLQPLVMSLGGLSLILGMIWLPLGTLMAWFASPLLRATLLMVQKLASGPLQPVFLPDFSFPGSLFFYSCLFILVFSPQIQEKLRKILVPSFLLTGMGLLVFSVWRTALPLLDQRLQIIVPAVGNSQSIFLQLPQGQTWEFSHAANSAASLQDLSHWKTHPSAPLNGAFWLAPSMTSQSRKAVTEGMPNVLLTIPAFIQTRNGSSLFEEMIPANSQWETLGLPGQIQLADRTQVYVSEYCQAGCAYLIEQGAFRLLVSAGNQPADLSAWLQSIRKAPTVILLAAQDSWEEWQTMFPASEILWLLAKSDVFPPQQRVISLPQTGWVKLATDGQKIWVFTER